MKRPLSQLVPGVGCLVIVLGLVQDTRAQSFQLPITADLTIGDDPTPLTFSSFGLPDAFFSSTELVSMDLQYYSPNTAYRVRIGNHHGQVVDLPQTVGGFNTGTGASFFDVFFELEFWEPQFSGFPHQFFYNDIPLHMASSNVFSLPLQPGVQYDSSNSVNLLVPVTNEVANTLQSLDFYITSTQQLPSFPTSSPTDGMYAWDGAVGAQWFDPPVAFGYNYKMTSDSLFTGILDFPTGFLGTFDVTVDGVTIATDLGSGDSVDFTGFPAGGVTEFTVTGINPLADPSDPYGFPLQLAFDTPTADFQMTAVVAVPGDYDGNGTVGPEDYTLWKTSFGSTSNLAADGNGNQIIDAADYTVWRDHLGQMAGSGSLSNAAVPEPSSLVLMALTALVGKRKKREAGT